MIYKTTNVNNAAQMHNQPETSFFELGIAPKILDIPERIRFEVPISKHPEITPEEFAEPTN